MPAGSSVETQLWARIRAHWQEKLVWTAALNIVFWSGYLYLSRHAFFPIHALPFTWIDRWIGFHPQPWSWIYESNFLLVGAVPWLMESRDHIRRYVTGFAVLTLISFLIFAVFPVASPRPSDLGANPFLILITEVDGPLNAFPSLHAGSLVFSLALIRRMFRPNRLVAGALAIWSISILIATLATKQHYAIDLIAGSIVGWFASAFAWRTAARPESTSARTRSRIVSTSQSGRK